MIMRIPTDAIDAESRSRAMTKPESTPTKVAATTPQIIATGNGKDISCNETGSEDSEAFLISGVIDKMPVV